MKEESEWVSERGERKLRDRDRDKDSERGREPIMSSKEEDVIEHGLATVALIDA